MFWLARLVFAVCLLLACSEQSGWAKRVAPASEVARLLDAIRGGSEGDRNRAVQRLYHLQNSTANSTLIEWAKAPSAQRRAIALWAIAVVRPEGSVRVVMNRLEDPRPAVRAAAALAAGALPIARSWRKLRKLANDNNPSVQSAAIRALALIGSKGIRHLSRILRTGNLEQRLLATAALAPIESRSATTHLRRAALSGPLTVRLSAAKVLLARSPGFACTVLRTMSGPQRTLGVRLQAIKTLGACRDNPSRKRLTVLTKHKDRQIRHAAAKAMAR